MTEDIKLSLLQNSHDFVDEALKKAILAETDPINWKYGIFGLVQSIELLLKERLRREHPILIFKNIDDPKHTVGLDLAIKRLKLLSSVEISKIDLKAIDLAKKWRNQIVHYEFEINPKELKLVFAQLLGFSMQFNKIHFDISLDSKINFKSWNEAIKIIEYSSELYKRAIDIIGKENREPDYIWNCPNCGYETFVVKDGINTCYICGFAEEVIECFDCKELLFISDSEKYLIKDGFYVKYCINCYRRTIDDERGYPNFK